MVNSKAMNDFTYLEQLNKTYVESSSQFDKQVLFIASGALGISANLVNQESPKKRGAIKRIYQKIKS